jgi:hypothetical protein
MTTPTRVRALADGEEIVFTDAPAATAPEADPRDLAVARRMRALWDTGAWAKAAQPPSRRPREAD